LLRGIMDALLARRWSRVLTLVVVVMLAGVGSLAGLQPDAAARGADVDLPSGSSYLLTGRVVRVADGDVFTLLVNGQKKRIRMASIDAPEMEKENGRKGQPQANASSKALNALIDNKTLT